MQGFEGVSRVRCELLVQIIAVEDQEGLAAGLAFHRVGIGLAVGDAHARLGGADRRGAAG